MSMRAAEWHNVLTDEQLWECGLTPSTKRGRIQRHVLHRVRRGINLFGSKQLTMFGRARVAELVGGPESFVTGWVALRARRVVDFEPTVMHVVTSRRCVDLVHDAAVVRCHRTERTFPDEYEVIDRVTLATACRAIYDLATHESVGRLLRLLREVTHRQLGNVDELERIASRYPTSGSAARIREVVTAYREGDPGSRSRSENEIYEAIENAWIVRARRNQMSGIFVEGKEIEFDVTWPGDHPLVLELDGSDHLDVAVARTDAREDRAVRAAGRFVLRVANQEFQLRFDEALADLVTMLDRFAPPGYHEAVARGEIR